MTLLLQDVRTRLFYQAGGTWTPHPEEAFDFQISAGMPEFHQALTLPGSELVLHSNEPAELRAAQVPAGSNVLPRHTHAAAAV